MTLANIGKIDDPVSVSKGGPWILLLSRPYDCKAMFNFNPDDVFYSRRRPKMENLLKILFREDAYQFARGLK